AKVKRWAADVAVGSEYGGSNHAVRFEGPITISVMQGGPVGPLPEVVRALDAELRQVGSSLSLVPDGLSGASIEVYYVPYSEFRRIGQKKGFQVHAVDNGSFWGFWDSQGRMTKGYVLLARDRLFGNSLRHFTYEEVTQVLGLMSDSSAFPDSVFFAAGSQGGQAQSLSELDKRLLRFHYRHVKPGFGRTAFEKTFDQHFWSMP
nr:DUF2927 domain-containing protein [Polyangiaceae bacterium]